MATSTLEHVNMTVSDPEKTASLLVALFDWRIRWHGPALNNGTTFHVGGKDSYVALYSPPEAVGTNTDNYHVRGGLNHIGVVVADLDEVENRVRAAGFETLNHADYEPGRRFYFHDGDGIEYEVVSYA
jgi:catechol 2,3-dioxygenase-like lactoylglutathione lyase family enzyme